MTDPTFAPAHFKADQDRVELLELIEAAGENAGIEVSVVTQVLESPYPQVTTKLFSAARKQRRRYFGNNVFLYGFLYSSTYCRNHCNFCLYRSDNPHAARYRKSDNEILASARKLADEGVHLIDLTSGEDPRYFSNSAGGFSALVNIIRRLKHEIGLPIMVSAGTLTGPMLDQIAEAGADWYACYQETHNKSLYHQLRAGQSFEDRFNSKLMARSKGLLIEEGLLCGVGEHSRDIADSVESMRDLGVDQVRAMTFVPQSGTPMNAHPSGDPIRELITIALLRLAFPDRLIPASLDVDGLGGLKQRLDAGANVVTSIVPPGQGLAGVAQASLDIEDGRRTVEGILPTLRECGLMPASVEQYRHWVASRRQQPHPGPSGAVNAC